MPKLLVIWPIIGAKHSLEPHKLPEVGADVCPETAMTKVAAEVEMRSALKDKIRRATAFHRQARTFPPKAEEPERVNHETLNSTHAEQPKSIAQKNLQYKKKSSLQHFL